MNWQKYASLIAVLVGLGTLGTWLVPALPWITRVEAGAMQQSIDDKINKLTNATSALQMDQRSDHQNALLTQLSILRLQLMYERSHHDEVAMAETQAEIDRITKQLNRSMR